MHICVLGAQFVSLVHMYKSSFISKAKSFIIHMSDCQVALH